MVSIDPKKFGGIARGAMPPTKFLFLDWMKPRLSVLHLLSLLETARGYTVSGLGKPSVRPMPGSWPKCSIRILISVVENYRILAKRENTGF